MLPNAPGLVSPTADPKRLLRKRNRLLADLHRAGNFDDETLRLACDEPVPTSAFPFPVLAPHLARLVKKGSPGQRIKTTLDAGLQRNLEAIVSRHLDSLDDLRIGNGAALVVETGTGKIRAYVGSREFFDSKHLGQVDGVIARRSSGSLLKPFLYALSIDEGLILPQTMVKDVPTYFHGFSPSNASERYNGLVRADEALVRSLNVPAARLLRRYGVFNFHRFLLDAEVTTLVRTADDYGLPLILGGAEVTLWDITRLFRSLASAGRIEPLRLQEPPLQAISSSSSFSPAAAYLVLDALRKRTTAGRGVLLAPVPGTVAAGLEDRHQLRPTRRVGGRCKSGMDDRRVVWRLLGQGQHRPERCANGRSVALRRLQPPSQESRTSLVSTTPC